MFIETPIFPTNVNFESMGTAEYEVFITKLYGGHHVADLTNDQPLHLYDVGYGIREEADLQTVRKHWHRVVGMFHFFRFKDWNDFKSCDREATPTAFDQVMGQGDGSNLTFQMVKSYVSGQTTPRTIEKPVIPSIFATGDGSRGSTGIILIGVQTSIIPSTRYSLTSVTGAEAALGHSTMGRVVFSANVTKVILGITKAVHAEVQTSTAHGLSVGDSVHFSSVGGMTQINGERGVITLIVATDKFQVDIDSSAYSTYTTGGVINTIPQTGENVSWGGEFHVPVRFAMKGLPNSWHSWKAGALDCKLEEVRLS